MEKRLAETKSAVELQAWLDEALSALHSLYIGTHEIEVYVIDRKVKYSEANIGQLESWVDTLKLAIDIKNGLTVCKNRPINVLGAIG